MSGLMGIFGVPERDTDFNEDTLHHQWLGWDGMGA